MRRIVGSLKYTCCVCFCSHLLSSSDDSSALGLEGREGVLGALDSWAGVSPTTGMNKAHAWVPFWGLTFMGRETPRALITVGIARGLRPSLLTV